MDDQHDLKAWLKDRAWLDEQARRRTPIILLGLFALVILLIACPFLSGVWALSHPSDPRVVDSLTYDGTEYRLVCDDHNWGSAVGLLLFRCDGEGCLFIQEEHTNYGRCEDWRVAAQDGTINVEGGSLILFSYTPVDGP